MVAAVTPFTREAEHMLRAPGLFNWSTVTLLGLVGYVYAVEIERSHWNVVLAGIAFWLMDWSTRSSTRSYSTSTATPRCGR